MFDSAALVGVIRQAATRLIENRELLTDLDIAIGDGDHGINMSRGSEEVLKKLEGGIADKDVGALLKSVGMTLVSTVGGASGPLYGTALMKAGAVVAGKDVLDADDALAMFEAAIEGIKMRGKSGSGEKTMLDALIPAFEAFKAHIDQPAVIVSAAQAGVEYTKTIVATKGRASYLGERSLGHQDPGARSSLIILQAVIETCTD